MLIKNMLTQQSRSPCRVSITRKVPTMRRRGDLDVVAITGRETKSTVASDRLKYATIAIVRFWRLGLKLPIHVVFSPRMGKINGKLISRMETIQTFGFVDTICLFNTQLPKTMLLE